jgi:hypothetical protein
MIEAHDNAVLLPLLAFADLRNQLLFGPLGETFICELLICELTEL